MSFGTTEEDWETSNEVVDDVDIVMDFEDLTAPVAEGYWRVVASDAEVKRTKADDGFNVVVVLKAIDAVNEDWEGRQVQQVYLSLKPQAAFAVVKPLSILTGEDMNRNGVHINRELLNRINGRTAIVYVTHDTYKPVGEDERIVPKITAWFEDGSVDPTLDGVNFVG